MREHRKIRPREPMELVGTNRLCSVSLDIGIDLSRSLQLERNVAIDDLLVENSFELVGHTKGPYILDLLLRGTRLAFRVSTENGIPVVSHIVGLGPFRDAIDNYKTICEAHVAAVRGKDPYRIEAIDMGRRAAHNEAALLLRERLSSKIKMDDMTARRLFTLISLLAMSGILL